MSAFSRILLCGLFLASCAAKRETSAPRPPGRPLFSFGVIADIQWGDKPTRGSRHYRRSLGKLVKAVGELNRRDVLFTVQLGDIIDGNATAQKTLLDLDAVLRAYDELKMPRFHAVGNHCLNVDRGVLQRKLGMRTFNYDFAVPGFEGWRFIVLDGNDAGYGKMSDRQLRWLSGRLSAAVRDRERVMIFCHYALLKSAAAHDRMEDPEPVLKVLDGFDCVVAYFAGHDHRGGYAFRNGVHHVTLRGMVETSDSTAYAAVEVYPDRLEVVGFGRQPPQLLDLL